MSELGLPFVVAITGLVVAVVCGVAVWMMSRRLKQEQQRVQMLEQQLTRQLELVGQSISGLTAGTVGIDRRMRSLENREKVLSERQETYEIQQADDQPYGQAIRLVQQGAGIRRLMEELDLGEGEAELIVRLHGQRDTA